MSGTNSPQGGLTRRSFLKTTAAVASATAVMGSTGALEALAEEYGDNQIETSEEQIFRGVCRPNCFAFCHLNVHVRDGKIVKTSRAPYLDERYSRICHRGLSHVQRVYDPDRIKYPMRRVEGTERGQAQWERISWDEAISQIAGKIKSVQEQYGPQGLAFLTISGNQALVCTGMYGRLQNMLRACNISTAVDNASYYGMMRMTGPATQMWESNEHTDLINAKTIVAWGANLTDAQVQSWHFVKEAMQNGTKLVVIDPAFTQLAAKADKWIRIRPGTDTALYMGLMNIFLQKNAINVPFLQKTTVAPFLVKEEDGRFLRGSDLGMEPVATGQTNPLTGQEVIYDPYMVVDSGQITALEAATSPEIDVEWNAAGIKCKTAYKLLKREILKYPISTVSLITGIPVETIYELADICLDQPVTHYVGYGPQAYSNGVHTTHAGMTMCALIGNLGYSGASYGSFWHFYFGTNTAFSMPTGANPTPAVNMLDLPQVARTQKFQGKDFPIKMLYIYSANPICTACDTNALLNDVWPNMEFIVTADSQMTDTARYSDMILPIAQWFEVVDATNAGQTVSLNLSEKAIEPLYESKSDSDIVRALAKELGIGEYFTQTDDEVLDECVDSQLSTLYGISSGKLRKDKEARFVFTNPYIAWQDGTGFSSPSGRLEFYLEDPKPRVAAEKEISPELIERERLPHFFPPSEAWSDNELYAKYPLILNSERPRFRVHSQWFNVHALRELDPEPTVKINPSDAEARGIKDGDYVECYNDRGHAVAKAVYSEAIMPGMLRYAKSWQMSQHKAGSWSELLSTDYDAFGVNSNFMDALCEVRIWNGGE